MPLIRHAGCGRNRGREFFLARGSRPIAFAARYCTAAGETIDAGLVPDRDLVERMVLVNTFAFFPRRPIIELAASSIKSGKAMGKGRGMRGRRQEG